MPAASALPESIQDLVFRNAAELRVGHEYDSHLQRLAETLEKWELTEEADDATKLRLQVDAEVAETRSQAEAMLAEAADAQESATTARRKAEVEAKDLLDEAAGFIRREAKTDKPFFLYFPLTAPHKPVLPHPRFRDRTKLGPYGDFIVQVDWTVGEVLRALDERGVAENTLVIFTSDNGGAYEADVGPYKGGKTDLHEAGLRVPTMVSWPPMSSTLSPTSPEVRRWA